MLVSVNHIVAVESFIKTESRTAAQHGFQQEFQRCDAPSHNTLLLWVSKWYQVGTVKESKPARRPLSAHTPDNVEPVRDAILQSPHKSAYQQPLAPHLEERRVRCITIHKKIQVAQELSEQYKVSQLQFHNEFLDFGEKIK